MPARPVASHLLASLLTPPRVVPFRFWSASGQAALALSTRWRARPRPSTRSRLIGRQRQDPEDLSLRLPLGETPDPGLSVVLQGLIFLQWMNNPPRTGISDRKNRFESGVQSMVFRTISALNTLVSEAVDIVVACTRGADGPRVSEIAAVEDQAGGPDATQFTVTELFHRRGATPELAWTGNVPVRCTRAFDDAGIEVRDVLQPASGDWARF